MKKIIFLFALVAATAATAQTSSFVQLMHDTTNNTYRFQRTEVRRYESITDSIVVDRFPEKWLDTTELKAYQNALIAANLERRAELRRLLALANAELDTNIDLFDQVNGEGAWLASQKSALLKSLQGAWTLIERNGETTRTKITITGSEFRKNANKFGTLSVGDDLAVTLSGYFNFNLVFQVNQAGNLTAERAGKTYLLRR